jgi:two-component system, OmpR family, sensor kinase
VSRLPIRIRLTLAFAVVMAIVLAALGAFLYVRLTSSLNEQITDDLETRSAAVASSDADPSLLAGDEGIARVIGSDVSEQVTLATPTVHVVLITTAELAEVRSGSVNDVERDGFRLRAEAIDGRVVVVGKSLEDRDEALDALLAQLLIALPFALLVSSVVGYLVAGAALRPVEAMRVEAEAISASEPDRRLPLPLAHDEVFRLGETLNDMLERLGSAIERERAFVADASHELRTPLALMKAELEVALRRPRTPDELGRALRSAAEETDRLVRLAEDLLLVARADRGALPVHREGLAAEELLAEVAGRFELRASEAGRAIEVVAPPGLALTGDRARLGQALGNLVDNALRHGAGVVRLEAVREDDFVELHVTDEGGGFPRAFLPHAFERFSRPDDARAGGGSGLGLAIVEAVAAAHGGSAGASNHDGGGADVWITVPTRLNSGNAPLRDRAGVG